MLNRCLALVLAAVILGGCVLQSRTPLYSDAEAMLALGETGGMVRMSSWKDGKWEPDAELAAIAVTGKHYEATAKSSTIALTFVPLSGSWFVLQAVEADKPAVYMLAEAKGGAANVRPLSCRDLRKDDRLHAWIDHDGDDCFIKPGAPAQELFTNLLRSPGEPTSRLEFIR